MKEKKYIALILWIVSLTLISWVIGIITKGNTTTWYIEINRSALSPPNYMFGIVWGILYLMIAISGWLIWYSDSLKRLHSIKILFIAQLLLNFSWTTLFFQLRFFGLSALWVACIIYILCYIIYKTYSQSTTLCLLLLPYTIWSIFALYLNGYIWLYN